MIIVTTESVAGHRIAETRGQVFGLVVRSLAIRTTDRAEVSLSRL